MEKRTDQIEEYNDLINSFYAYFEKHFPLILELTEKRDRLVEAEKRKEKNVK
jgi:hypothetical protein